MPVPILPGLQLSWPTNWAALFERDAPLLVEIGFGSGTFLVDLGQKRPSCNIIGLEISLPSLRRGARKVSQRGLSNVAIVQADANYALQALILPDSLSGVYINFPDPWPKPGHEQRRLIDACFLHLVASRMPAGATLDIATDHSGYAQAIAACLEETPYFDSRTGETAVIATGRLGTKYEQKGLAEGRPGHYFFFKRNETPTAHSFPVLKELKMPHVVMESPLSLTQIAERFELVSLMVDTTTVSLIELFQSTRDDKLLIEAYVNEPPLSQRIGATIRRRRSGQLVVALHEIGFPRPTAGTHYLIHHLAHWLLSLHPDTIVVHSTLRENSDGIGNRE
jgi:tRNA (guanine-N7-)-methyltransferase